MNVEAAIAEPQAVDAKEEASKDYFPSVFDLIIPNLRVLWKDLPIDMNMKVVEANVDSSFFRLRGICPYCRSKTTFPSKTSLSMEGCSSSSRIYAACKCDACSKYILGVLRPARTRSYSISSWVYEYHVPIGYPDDSVPEEIPTSIADDYQEAIRCHWIKGYKACVLMCRRALEESCVQQKAEGKNLYEMIDDLANKQTITKALKNMAHRIRLFGNRGAHPKKPTRLDDMFDASSIKKENLINFTNSSK